MNLAAAKHCIIGSIVELNKIAGSIEYSGGLYGSLKLLENVDTIWFTGIGKSGLVAQRGASMMRTIGKSANFIDPVAALHGECGAIQSGNVIVALSHSGETKELLDFLLYRRSTVVIGITRYASTLANRSAYVLPVQCEEELPTISCMAQNAWIDALVVALANNVEQTLQKTHPGGDIGRRLHEPGTGKPERTSNADGARYAGCDDTR